MVYSDRFLCALGAWQRGWREDPSRREEITSELVAAIGESDLPKEVRSINQKCFRKRFLVPNNPQNEGDFGPLIMNGSLDDERMTNWTTELKFAQDFKNPLRDGTVSAVFGRVPLRGEVILNIPALWRDSDFRTAVHSYSHAAKPNADALQNFKGGQSEIILDAPLQRDEIEGFCGRSSPFELLCELAEIHGEEARDRVWRRLCEAGVFPEQPFWLNREAALRALANTEAKFAEQLRKLETRTKSPNCLPTGPTESGSVPAK
jgi:hypothetical protein